MLKVTAGGSVLVCAADKLPLTFGWFMPAALRKLYCDCQQLSRGSRQRDADRIGRDVACEGVPEQLLI